MLNPRPYNKRYNSLIEQLKAEEGNYPEYEVLVKRLNAIYDYMERQGYTLARTPYPYYFVPKWKGKNT